MTDTNEHQTPETADSGDEGIDATPESTEAVAPVAETEEVVVATEMEPEAAEAVAEAAEPEATVAVADPPAETEAAAESVEPETAVAVADPPEALAEAGPSTKNPVAITEHVRRRLSNQICKALTDENGYIQVITLSSKWDQEFLDSVRVQGDERNLIMSPQRIQEFVLEARRTIQEHAAEDRWPAILVAPEARSFIRNMLERVSPMTQVISHNEIHRNANLRTLATIGKE